MFPPSSRSYKRQRVFSPHDPESISGPETDTAVDVAAAVAPSESTLPLSSKTPTLVNLNAPPHTPSQNPPHDVPQHSPQNGPFYHYPQPGPWYPQPSALHSEYVPESFAIPRIQQMTSSRSLPPIIHASGSHLADRMNKSATTHQAYPILPPEIQKPLFAPVPPIYSEVSSSGPAEGTTTTTVTPPLPQHKPQTSSFSRLPLNFLVHDQNSDQSPTVLPRVPQEVTPPSRNVEPPVVSPPFADNLAIDNSPSPSEENPQTPRLSEPPRNHSTTKDQIMRDVESSFVNLMPSLTNLNTHNVCSFLVEVLKQCDEHVSLDEFFNLLYTCELPELDPASTSGLSPSSYSKLMGLRLCHLIVKTFYNPESAVGLLDWASIKRLQSSSLNFHELLREFLALKIILSSVKRVANWSYGHSGLARISLYKVYYIFCHKLVQRYPGISNGASQNLILGQSQLGKLINLVFPNIKTKRLGRRGMSKFHYIGLTWNLSIVSPDIVGLLDLEIPQLEEYFNHIPKKNVAHRQASLPAKIPAPIVNPEANYFKTIPSLNSSPAPKSPLRSFVDLSNRYPNSDCSPRIWNSSPNRIPQQSEWAKFHIAKSLDALKKYDVQFDILVQNCTAGLFSEYDESGVPEIMVKALNIFSRVSAPEKSLLHLFLIVLLVMFPVAIASDEEVPETTKIQFRNSVKHCITRLECESSYFAATYETSLSIFMRILRKMVHLSELTSCKVPPRYTENVVKEMIRDLDSADYCKSQNFPHLSALEEAYIDSITMSMNAFSFTFMHENSPTDEGNAIAAVTSLAKTLKKAVMVSKDMMSVIPMRTKSEGLKYVPQDVAYQVFKISLENFHAITLADSNSLKFPIPLLTFIIHHKSNSLQYASFHDFGKRDPELDKETFKCWWMFTSMFSEYMSIFSEMVALAATLS
ncbi:hypothetical protein JCM33374_g1279 [Metschnikowia sp. JCM 33374]|nr:hypothetical protein JCM33374_g1279 [Metschnikowia sp. JCM 33374]